MCGIVGFTGAAQAAPILLDGLAKLEYRGYDSAGMAVQNAAGKIEVVKAKGRLKVLSEMTDGGSAVPGSCGIGASKLPWPNSWTTLIAIFLTAMCAATRSLMPCAIWRSSPR